MSLVFVGMACFFIVGAGAGFLWNKSQIHELGQQIRAYEVRLEKAKGHRLMLEQTYAMMCSRLELDQRVKRMKLEMGPPQPDQIVRLWEISGTEQDQKLLARRPTSAEEGTN